MRARTLVLPPPCVVVRPQKHLADCGLAALAMALGLPYESVFQAAPLAARTGLTTRQLQAVATKLGARLLSRPKADLHADTGILGIEFPRRNGHWLYLHAGVLVDPSDGSLWDTEDYAAHTRGTWDEFLVITPRLQPRSRARRREARR